MDLANEDLLRLWNILNYHGVRYIMLGGFAVHFHGHSRYTDDADLYVEDTPDNRERLGAAMEELGIGPKEIFRRFQFIPGWNTLSLNNGFPLDIMMNVKGLEEIPFSECYDAASYIVLDEIKVPFLHLNHLILTKEAANRPKDQQDLIALRQIEELRKGYNQ